MKTEEQINAELRGIRDDLAKPQTKSAYEILEENESICKEALYVLSLDITKALLRANLKVKRKQLTAINEGVAKFMLDLGVLEGHSMEYAKAKVIRHRNNYIKNMGKASAERTITVLEYLLN